MLWGLLRAQVSPRADTSYKCSESTRFCRGHTIPGRLLSGKV
jgi:hypothetical protein